MAIVDRSTNTFLLAARSRVRVSVYIHVIPCIYIAMSMLGYNGCGRAGNTVNSSHSISVLTHCDSLNITCSLKSITSQCHKSTKFNVKLMVMWYSTWCVKLPRPLPLQTEISRWNPVCTNLIAFMQARMLTYHRWPWATTNSTLGLGADQESRVPLNVTSYLKAYM